MLLDKTKTYLIDLDGTMYKGNDILEEALVFIEELQKHQIAYVFVTNNAMRTPAMIRKKMEAMGFKNLRDEDFFTSAMAAVAYMQRKSDKRNAFCIGEEGLQEALKQGGYRMSDKDVDLVFVGLERTADFKRYCEALQHLRKGAMLVGTNGDRRLPEGDHYIIGNGAILQMLIYASEAEHIIIGKPSSYMMEETLAYAHKRKGDCVVLGDNLETDIAFAFDNQVESIMVCTGVHTKEDALKADKKPDAILASLKEIIIK